MGKSRLVLSSDPVRPIESARLRCGTQRGPVRALAIGRDGALVLVGREDGTIELFHGRAPQPVAAWKGHDRAVVRATWGEDRFVTIDDSGVAKTWDTRSRKERSAVRGGWAGARWVAFSPCGNRAVSTADGRNLDVWSVESGSRIASFGGHADPVGCAAFALDGRVVSRDAGGVLKIWDSSTAEERRSMSGKALPFVSASVSPDGRLGFMAREHAAMELWDLEEGRLLYSPLANTLVGSPTFAAGGSFVAFLDDQRLRVLDIEGALLIPLVLEAGPLTSLQVTGDWAGIGTEDGSLILCRLRSDLSFLPEKAAARAWMFRGRHRGHAGDAAGALAAFNTAIRLDPGGDEAYHQRGNVRAELGDLDGAIADFQEHLRSAPGCSGGLLGLAAAFVEKREWRSALAATDRAIDSDPYTSTTWWMRGVCREALGETDAALADLTRAIEMDPKCVNAYLLRARLRASRDEHEGAVRDLARALERAPEDWSAREEARSLLEDERWKAGPGGS